MTKVYFRILLGCKQHTVADNLGIVVDLDDFYFESNRRSPGLAIIYLTR